MTDWDDEYDDDEFDDDHDDAESVTVPCSHCGADIYEDADQCPMCGEFQIRGSRQWEGRPLWWIVLGITGIIAVVMTLSILP